nr:unnamed protein product [Digitaria exilis]
MPWYVPNFQSPPRELGSLLSDSPLFLGFWSEIVVVSTLMVVVLNRAFNMQPAMELHHHHHQLEKLLLPLPVGGSVELP